jgi:hypothetical protein
MHRGIMMTNFDFTNGTKIVAADEQVFSELDNEVVILKLDNGTYYGLSDVGVSIWNLIQEPRTVEEIANNLLEEYEVEPEQCRRELEALLQDLAANHLIEISSGSNS